MHASSSPDYPFGPPPQHLLDRVEHRRPQSMRCHAVVVSRWDARHRVTRLDRLRGKTPLKPRPINPSGFEPLVGGDPGAARVSVAASAAGPLGGDLHVLDIVVGAGSALVLSDVSATLLLPGPHGERSRTLIRVRVEPRATLTWIPHPLIAASGCFHDQRVEIDLDQEARLFYREEIVLGRAREAAGNLRSHLVVRRGGTPLTAQELRLGPAFPLAATPSVLGGHRCVGTTLAVDPVGITPSTRLPAPLTAVMTLDGTAVQATALADDMLALRSRLDAAGRACGTRFGAEHHRT